MVERDHAMDFGARQVQRVGDHRNGGLRNVAERRLQGVQDQQRAGLIHACSAMISPPRVRHSIARRPASPVALYVV